MYLSPPSRVLLIRSVSHCSEYPNLTYSILLAQAEERATKATGRVAIAGGFFTTVGHSNIHTYIHTYQTSLDSGMTEPHM